VAKIHVRIWTINDLLCAAKMDLDERKSPREAGLEFE